MASTLASSLSSTSVIVLASTLATGWASAMLLAGLDPSMLVKA